MQKLILSIMAITSCCGLASCVKSQKQIAEASSDRHKSLDHCNCLKCSCSLYNQAENCNCGPNCKERVVKSFRDE